MGRRSKYLLHPSLLTILFLVFSCGLAEGFCLCPEDAREWLAVKDPDLYAALVAIYGNGDPSVQAGLHICMNRPNNINCNNAPIDD